MKLWESYVNMAHVFEGKKRFVLSAVRSTGNTDIYFIRSINYSVARKDLRRNCVTLEFSWRELWRRLELVEEDTGGHFGQLAALLQP